MSVWGAEGHVRGRCVCVCVWRDGLQELMTLKHTSYLQRRGQLTLCLLCSLSDPLQRHVVLHQVHTRLERQTESIKASRRKKAVCHNAHQHPCDFCDVENKDGIMKFNKQNGTNNKMWNFI